MAASKLVSRRPLAAAEWCLRYASGQGKGATLAVASEPGVGPGNIVLVEIA